MARRRYAQSRKNAVLQWTIPVLLLIGIVLVQDRLGREIGWIALLAVLGFMVWLNVLYEKSRDEPTADEETASAHEDRADTGAA
ncbi:MAG: hypothetical protein KIS91_09440 [Anaerolineae bacterium]|nr:hypothetical protein [Anaerolineae bacterium]